MSTKKLLLTVLAVVFVSIGLITLLYTAYSIYGKNICSQPDSTPVVIVKPSPVVSPTASPSATISPTKIPFRRVIPVSPSASPTQ